MRQGIVFVVGLACGVLLASAPAQGAADPDSCAVCTCQGNGLNDTIVCVNQYTEELEEAGPCGSACSSINQSYKSIELVQAACEDLPACDHAETPAASPLALAGGAIAMLLLGGLTLRRVRQRAAQS